MKLEEQQRFISSAVEHLEQAKDDLHSIHTLSFTINDIAEFESAQIYNRFIKKFITDVISDIQEVIDTLDLEKEEDEE